MSLYSYQIGQLSKRSLLSLALFIVKGKEPLDLNINLKYEKFCFYRLFLFTGHFYYLYFI